jgi:hypothetical protein
VIGTFCKQSVQYVPFDDGGDSGIRTPDLRIMMKIAPIFLSEINDLQEPYPAV